MSVENTGLVTRHTLESAPATVVHKTRQLGSPQSYKKCCELLRASSLVFQWFVDTFLFSCYAVVFHRKVLPLNHSFTPPHLEAIYHAFAVDICCILTQFGASDFHATLLLRTLMLRTWKCIFISAVECSVSSNRIGSFQSVLVRPPRTPIWLVEVNVHRNA